MISMATIHNNTAQEIFDFVAVHLLTQKRKSMMIDPNYPEEPICAYRGEGDTKCAAGACIADEDYRIEFEGKNADFVSARITGKYLTCYPAEILLSLQYIHDQIDEVEWKDQLSYLAERTELSTAVLERF